MTKRSRKSWNEIFLSHVHVILGNNLQGVHHCNIRASDMVRKKPGNCAKKTRKLCGKKGNYAENCAIFPMVNLTFFTTKVLEEENHLNATSNTIRTRILSPPLVYLELQPEHRWFFGGRIITFTINSFLHITRIVCDRVTLSMDQ